MQLSAREMARLRARHRARHLRALRDTFCRRNPAGVEREKYFDAWISAAEQLEAMSDDDLLCLLEIGFRRGAPLTQTEELNTCISRQRWYGRRLWLRERLSKIQEATEQDAETG